MDVNGFGRALLEYKRKSHEGMTKDQIMADLTKIFDEFGIDGHNFWSIKMATDPKNEASLVPFVSKMAEGIIKSELLKKQLQRATLKQQDESNEKNNANPKQKPKTLKPEQLLKKRPICFNVAEVGDLPLDAARGYMEKKLRMRGFSEEEMNQPLEQMSVLGLDDKAMNLNISPNESIVDQLVEIAKKLYLVLVKEVPANDVRDMTLTTLLTHAKDDDTKFNVTTESGTRIKGSVDTMEANTEVSVGANGESGANVDNDKLDEWDNQEIAMYGLEGIATHSEMEDFRESYEYELLQNLSKNEMSKSDNSD